MSTTLTILITGANQGLGFEAAKCLSKHAHVRLFLAGRRSSPLKDAVDTIRTGSDCRAKVEDGVVMDISDDESIKAGVAEVEKQLGPGKGLDVLVNNAGIAIESSLLTRSLREVLQDTYAVNAFGTACTTDFFLPLLKRSTAPDCPRVVNVSSAAGSLGMTTRPDYSFRPVIAYGTSKTALNGLTVALARMHPEIHAVCVCPGYNKTNLNSYAAGAADLEGGVGAKLIAEYALEKKGKSAGFYNRDGEVPW
ncbi:hypothetical protein HWV62_35953 [Athelia sp. TMB]|nr:hypothetical protein HWV62_35953 [Athelia sp. TMB]